MRTATLLLALLLAAAAHGHDLESYELRLQGVFLDTWIASADYDTHLLGLIELIKDDPAHPASLVALRRCMDIEDEVADPRPLFELLKKFKDAGFRPCGEAADDFASAYIHLARRFTADPAWHEVARRWRGVTEALVIGPYADNAAPAHDDVFPPELLHDFQAVNRGAFGNVTWKPLKHFDPLGDRMDLHAQERWLGFGYYVAIEVVSAVQQDARIVLALNASGKVWLNGIQIADHDTRRGNAPAEWSLHAGLKRGSNLLVVKLSTIAGLRVRLRDLSGQPLRDVVTRAPSRERPVVPVTGVALQDHTHECFHYMRLADQAELAGNRRTAAVLQLAAAQTFGRLGMPVASAISLERAIELLPDHTLMRLEYLRNLERNELASTSEKRRLVRRLTDELLELEPAPLPAVFEKARLLANDERYREAVELLQAAQGDQPDWRIQLELARLFDNADWRMEHEAALRAALRAGPNALPALRAASRHYAAVSSFALELKIDRHRLTLVPGDRDTHMSLVSTLTRTGDVPGAINHLRHLIDGDPTNEFLLERLAELLAADGKLNDALQVHETLASRTPRPEHEYHDAARLCLQHGRESEAVKYLERALAIDPGFHLARRMLQRIRGETENFWAPWALGIDEVMRHDVTSEQFPRADSALVLDELIQVVYADGSSISYVHTIRKILTQDGVDMRGREEISGELVTARTIRADGTVLEPISQPGGVIEFPGVEVGAYLDVAYIYRNDGGPLETLDGDSFYFMDSELYEPFAISRWVLVTPPGMPLNVIRHNLHPDDKGVSIRIDARDDNVVYTWDVRDPRLPEYESFMPSPLEFIPWIEIVNPRDWRERARRAAADGLRKAMITPLISARARALTQNVEGDIAKVRTIYDWVNASITTSGDSWNPHQTLKAMAGDRDRLFASICAAAGIELGFAFADFAPPFKQAPPDSTPRPHWAYPHRRDFEAFLYVVEDADGSRVYVDMQDRMRPFGALTTRLSNAPVVMWLRGRYELGNLPGVAAGSDRFENQVHIRLRDDGSAELEGLIRVHGERSYRAKEEMRSTPYDDLCTELEADLAQHYRGFEATECRFPRIGEVGEPLVREYTGEVGSLARREGNRLTLELPGEKMGRLLSSLVDTERRAFDIVIALDLVQFDEIRISPPEGFVFSELPADLMFPTAPLLYSLQFRMDDGDLVVNRRLVLGPGRFRPHEYADVVEQIKAIRRAEDSTLNLVKVSGD